MINKDKKLKKVEKELAHVKRLVNIDELTGILNRRGFLFYAEKIFKEISAVRKIKEEHRRNFETKDISVLFMDVDFFKKFNDKYGHLGGDETLRHVVKIISHRLRGFDLFGRWGGEEFVILLVGANEISATHIAEELRRLVEESPVKIKNKLATVTVSIGVKGIKNEKSLHQLINEADGAMYLAKKAGRNCVRVVV